MKLRQRANAEEISCPICLVFSDLKAESPNNLKGPLLGQKLWPKEFFEEMEF